MPVKTYYLSKGNIQLSEHFRLSEFQCHDGTDKILVNSALIDTLETLFKQMNAKSIDITSGYRTPSHSVAVGGYSTDQHTQGNAADITVRKQDGTLYSSADICCALEDMDHQGGIGRINLTESVHVDVRGYKCWFDEVNGEQLVNSWYAYLRIQKKPKPEPSTGIYPKGIDLSEHNENVYFSDIKKAGYSFVILRAGYGRYDSQKDILFEAYYKAAKAAGLAVGAYWYSHALNKEGARLEAQTFMNTVRGKIFELPLFLDMEEPDQFALGKGAVSAMIRAFLTELKAAGKRPGLYMSSYFINNYVEDDIHKAYPLWVADYTGSLGYSGKGEVSIWQYSSTGRIDGYNNNLDVNVMYKNLIQGAAEEKLVLTDREQTYEVRAGDTWDSVGARYGISGISLLEFNNYKTADAANAAKTVSQRFLQIPAKWTPGDVDGDGKITAADARKALMISAKLLKPSPAERMRGDIDGDGKISSADAKTILRKAGKLV